MPSSPESPSSESHSLEASPTEKKQDLENSSSDSPSSDVSPPEKKQKLGISSSETPSSESHSFEASPPEKKQELENSSSDSPSTESHSFEASPPEKKLELENPSSDSPSSDVSPLLKKQKLGISSSETPSSEVSSLQEIQISKEAKWLEEIIGEEAYFKMFDDHGSDHDEDGLDGKHEMTDAELQEYLAAVEASGGFDVPCFPNVSCCGMITPVGLSDYHHQTLKPLCVAAIDYFNEKEHKKYEYLKLKKANAQTARGLNYYLTFEAFNPEDYITETFQALVLRGIPEKKGDDIPKTVHFCKPKVDSTRTECRKVAWPAAPPFRVNTNLRLPSVN